MRELLQPRAGKRHWYRATFVAIENDPGRTFLRACFWRIADHETGEVLADHMWFKAWARMLNMGLDRGDEVLFNAQVSQYKKGRKGEPEEKDYGFVKIVGFQKTGKRFNL